MTVDVRQAEGLWLTGEYRGGFQESPRPKDGGGEWPGKFKASVLFGRRVLDVEYPDEAAFEAACGDDVPAFGSPVTLAVGVRAAKGYVFYFGRRSGADQG